MKPDNALLDLMCRSIPWMINTLETLRQSNVQCSYHGYVIFIHLKYTFQITGTGKFCKFLIDIFENDKIRSIVESIGLTYNKNLPLLLAWLTWLMDKITSDHDSSLTTVDVDVRKLLQIYFALLFSPCGYLREQLVLTHLVLHSIFFLLQQVFRYCNIQTFRCTRTRYYKERN